MARAAKLYYELEGPEDAPVLVLANSLGTNLSMWEDQASELRQRFRLLRYNHRGHEGSEAPPGPYSIAELGSDLLSLLDELGIENFSFAGLSIGGMVGMWLSSEVPDRLQRLVLCCTSAQMDPEVWIARIQAVRRSGTASIASAVVERWFTPALRQSAPDTVQWAQQMVANTPDEGYAACCEAILEMDLRDRLPGITAPTLIIAGEDDQAIPPEHAEKIQASIPGSELFIFPDAAHLANIDQPPRVTTALLDHVCDKTTQ